MGYLNSSKIKVFPFAKLRQGTNVDTSNRLFYEYNIADITRNISDNDSFIVSGTVNSSGVTTNELRIVISGYEFVISSGVDLPTIANSSTGVYASITITDNQLANQDEDVSGTYVFKSLVLSSSASGTASLKILEKVNNAWQIPTESLQKFSVNSLIVNSDNVWILDGQS